MFFPLGKKKTCLGFKPGTFLMWGNALLHYIVTFVFVVFICDTLKAAQSKYCLTLKQQTKKVGDCCLTVLVCAVSMPQSCDCWVHVRWPLVLGRAQCFNSALYSQHKAELLQTLNHLSWLHFLFRFQLLSLPAQLSRGTLAPSTPQMTQVFQWSLFEQQLLDLSWIPLQLLKAEIRFSRKQLLQLTFCASVTG